MSAIVALTRAYPSVMGGPVLRRVAMNIFSLRYFTHCMACNFCHDSCCRYGVDIDLDNAARLRAMPQDFKDHIAVPESEWFTPDIIEDAEFSSGRHVRSRVRNGACVFLDRTARGCKIHSYCLEKGLDYHSLKPMVSVLFPLTFEQGALVAASEALDNTLVCAGSGPSLYAGVRDELAYYFGAALIAELDSLEHLQV